jgi:hypothetical protein
MNELYKTVTADVWSITLFYLIFLAFTFSLSVFVASVIKTAIDYYFVRQIQYLTTLAGISIANTSAKDKDDSVGTKD